MRPLLHSKRFPDLVRDDLAFRQLRKDAGLDRPALRADATPTSTPTPTPTRAVNTDKLDELLDANSRIKTRAVRSLSANIAQLIRQEAANPHGGSALDASNGGGDDDDDDDAR